MATARNGQPSKAKPVRPESGPTAGRCRRCTATTRT